MKTIVYRKSKKICTTEHPEFVIITGKKVRIFSNRTECFIDYKLKKFTQGTYKEGKQIKAFMKIFVEDVK